MNEDICLDKVKLDTVYPGIDQRSIPTGPPIIEPDSSYCYITEDEGGLTVHFVTQTGYFFPR